MKYYKFSNAGGKQWIIPDRHTASALELYQPSGRNGLLVKRWLPTILKMDCLGIAKKFLHIETVDNPISDTLNKELASVFQIDQLEYSVFLGTPCAHQKTTIQIFQDSKILGYCKITYNPEIGKLFEGEANTMKRLADCKITKVPQCLLCKRLDSGEWVFVQSTTKTLNSTVPHEWTVLHERFLSSMYEATKTTMPYNKTDFYKSMKYIQSCMGSVGLQQRLKTVYTALERINKAFAGKDIEVCAFHSDFTPWNMFEENGLLFVFDWEYASFSYPPYLDRMHFFMQTAIYEKRLDVNQIIQEYERIDVHGRDKDMVMSCYLLNILSFYTKRGGGQLENGLEDIASIWFELLEYINNKSKQ